jgi:hypothetical protein
MNELAFDQNARHADPNESAHRRARFRDGWKNATGGRTYAAETLRDLTWVNPEAMIESKSARCTVR